MSERGTEMTEEQNQGTEHIEECSDCHTAEGYTCVCRDCPCGQGPGHYGPCN